MSAFSVNSDGKANSKFEYNIQENNNVREKFHDWPKYEEGSNYVFTLTFSLKSDEAPPVIVEKWEVTLRYGM